MATRVSKAFGKALSVQVTKKASRGSMSTYVVNAPHEYGQPLPSQTDGFNIITPQRMREIAFRTPTASATMNTIIDFASGVKPKLRASDASKPLDTNDFRIQHLAALLRVPNRQEHWKRFARKLMRALIVYGFAAVEIERNGMGGVANLWVLDSQTLKADFDEHGTILGYDQIDALGRPIRGADGVHGWQPQEIIWFVLDPDADTAYSYSRMAQVFTYGVIESLMLSYVGARFTDSNIPFGTYDLGDITQDELDIAVEQWNKQVQQLGFHRVIITGSKGGAKWTPFGSHLKDLDAANLFSTVRSMIMGVFGVTMNELGESQDVNKSNGYNLSFVFKHRCLYPLLDEVYDTLSAFLVEREMGLPQAQVGYEEIDSRDDLLQSQIDELQLKSGTTSINDIRNRQGKPDIDGGDKCYVFTGSAWIPVELMWQYAVAELNSVEYVNLDMAIQAQMALEGGAQSPTAGGQVKPPLVRSPQIGEQMHTPDAKGSATPRLQLPRVTLGANKNRTRGPVQTMRAQGLRKEEATGQP